MGNTFYILLASLLASLLALVKFYRSQYAKVLIDKWRAQDEKDALRKQLEIEELKKKVTDLDKIRKEKQKNYDNGGGDQSA